MIENLNPNNNQEENTQKKVEENNKLNYSFSPANVNNSNSKINNNNNQKNEKEKEKEIKIKKSIKKGKILEGQFIIGEEIGKGTFGVVRIATHIITGEKVAVKMLYKDKILEESDKKRLEREIKILKVLRHRNIVQLYNVIQTSSTIYLVMEHIKGKELFEIIVHKKRLSELESLRYFQQLISGVEYLGKIRVAHRDLKPENLLIDSRNNLKIADFGLSNMYKNNELLSTACGSPCYAAPEMLSGEKYYGLSADIWSSGIILYTMLVGRLPFEDKDNKVLYQKIKEGNFIIPDFLSENAKDFLVKILNVDPKKRYNISQIKKHPWFNQLDQRKYMSKGLLLNKFIVPIDEDIVSKMENEYEYNSKEIRINLLANKHNHITTTYYLILKKKIKKGINSVCDMTSNDFINYIHNPKNLLANYNGDWNRLFKERGIKKKNIERVSTFKSNSSHGNNNKNENINANKNKNEINDNSNKDTKKISKNNFEEDKILFNNKSEDFLIEKNDNKNGDIKSDELNHGNHIKNKFAFENNNNEFKEKINELNKQKISKSNSKNNIKYLNIYLNNKENENILASNNNNEDKNISNNEVQNKDELIKNGNFERIIPINLEEIDKKISTPITDKEKKLNANTNSNIHVNTIPFSGSSNNKNLTSFNKSSKNSENSQKNGGNIPKFRIKKTSNSKSAEKGNKIKKKAIIININKINLENKYNLKNEKKITAPTKTGISNNIKKMTYQKTIPNSKNFKNNKNMKKNNSSKILEYKNINKRISKNNLNRSNNNSIINNNKDNSRFKSVNKKMIKLKINKNRNYFGNTKNNINNGNKLTNKIIPSFSIDKNKVSYKQITNYSKKISIEGIYYAHKKNLKEINNIYNNLSYQTKYKNSDQSMKKFV